MKLRVVGEITDILADKFVAALADAGDEDIIITVDSVGGQVVPAMEMATAVEAYPGHADAILIQADSAALVVGLAADRVTVARDAAFLLHPPSIEIPRSVAVSSTELRAAADNTDGLFKQFTRLMERRSGNTDGFWRLLAAEGRRLSAEEMVKLGLADEISVYPRAWLRSGVGV